MSDRKSCSHCKHPYHHESDGMLDCPFYSRFEHGWWGVKDAGECEHFAMSDDAARLAEAVDKAVMG